MFVIRSKSSFQLLQQNQTTGKVMGFTTDKDSCRLYRSEAHAWEQFARTSLLRELHEVVPFLQA